MSEPALHGVGIDVVDVPRMARIFRRGDAVIARWFSASERDMAASAADPGLAFAVCFAVKEAAWKASGVARPGDPVPWREITVRAGPLADRWCVELRGWVGARAPDGLRVGAHSRILGDVALAIAHTAVVPDAEHVTRPASGRASAEIETTSLGDGLDEHRRLVQVGRAAALLLDVAEHALDLIGSQASRLGHGRGVDAVVHAEEA